MHEERNLDSMEAVVDIMADAGTDERVCVGDLVDEIDGNAFGPLMLVPALIAVTPASGIPGLTATCGLIIALIAVQIVLRRKALWLPFPERINGSGPLRAMLVKLAQQARAV